MGPKGLNVKWTQGQCQTSSTSHDGPNPVIGGERRRKLPELEITMALVSKKCIAVVGLIAC
jgi:hypothetical protein